MLSGIVGFPCGGKVCSLSCCLGLEMWFLGEGGRVRRESFFLFLLEPKRRRGLGIFLDLSHQIFTTLKNVDFESVIVHRSFTMGPLTTSFLCMYKIGIQRYY